MMTSHPFRIKPQILGLGQKRSCMPWLTAAIWPLLFHCVTPVLRSAHTGLLVIFPAWQAPYHLRVLHFLPFLPSMLFTQIQQLVPKHHSDLSLHVTFAEREYPWLFLFKIFVPQPLPFYFFTCFFFYFCYLPFYLFIYVLSLWELAASKMANDLCLLLSICALVQISTILSVSGT